MKIKRILLISDGFGDHIYPTLVVAKYFRSKGKDFKWISTKTDLLNRVNTKYKFNIEYITLSVLKDNFLNQVVSFFKNFKYIYLMLSILIEYKPDLIICMGGVITNISILSSWLYRTPVIVHEKDAYISIYRKYLYYLSTKILQTYPGVMDNAVTVGNPIRQNILNILTPNIRLKNRQGVINILVLNGSSESLLINDIIYNSLEHLDKNKFFILHQIGLNNKDWFATKKKYPHYNVIDYIDKISEMYNKVDLVISRATSIMVSELCAVGIAAIYVPTDIVQYHNVKFLRDLGAAFIIKENKFNVKYLCKILHSLNHQKLYKISNLCYSTRINNSNKMFFNELENMSD